MNGEFSWYKKGDEDKDGKYEGGILNGIPSNEGTLTWPDGEKYTGQWKDGRKNGQGTLTFYSGNKYEGVSRMGNITGEDCLHGLIQTSMRVNLKDGKKHGHGEFIYSGRWEQVCWWIG